jgi:hypothetical protein
MKRLWKQSLMMTAILAMGTPVFAGGLYLEVGNPEANAEAKAMHAILVARVTACHEPAKSTVTATAVQLSGDGLRRTELKVVPLANPGTFAIVGTLPAGNSAIDLAVTNPEYKNNYEPRVLIRSDTTQIQWASVKRFFSKPPTVDDIKAVISSKPAVSRQS